MARPKVHLSASHPFVDGESWDGFNRMKCVTLRGIVGGRKYLVMLPKEKREKKKIKEHLVHTA